MNTCNVELQVAFVLPFVSILYGKPISIMTQSSPFLYFLSIYLSNEYFTSMPCSICKSCLQAYI